MKWFKKHVKEDQTVDPRLVKLEKARATPDALQHSLSRAVSAAETDQLLRVSAWWEEPSTLKILYAITEHATETDKEECYCIGAEIIADFPDVGKYVENFTTHQSLATITVK